MKKFIKNISTPLKVLILAAIVILGTHYVLADWTNPPANPPSSNVEAPLNVGASAQIKSGGLIIANGGVDPGLIVASGKVGIGTANPTAQLHIVSSPNSSTIRTSDGTVTTDIFNGNLAGWVGTFSNHPLYLYTNNGAAQFKVFTDNKVGAAQYCDLNGANCSTPPFGGGAGFWTASGNNIYNTNTANVGIGDTTPTNKLDVTGGASGGIGLNDKLAISGGSGIDMWLRLNQTSQFTAGVYIPSVLRTDGNFQVGVNTTGTFYAPIGGTVNVGHDMTLGTALTSGIAAVSINLPGGNKISGNYNYSNPSDNNYGNVIVQTVRGFLVCAIGCAGTDKFSVDSVGNATASGYYYNSDLTLKKNIQPLQDSLSKIMQLKGVSFDWKSTGKSSVGVIAQDVEKVYPELVSTDPKTGLKSVEYGNLVAPLIEAVKQQQQEIQDLQTQVKELQSKIK